MGLFEIPCLGRLFTIPVSLPGTITVRVGGPMEEFSDVRPVLLHVCINYLFFSLVSVVTSHSNLCSSDLLL